MQTMNTIGVFEVVKVGKLMVPDLDSSEIILLSEYGCDGHDYKNLFNSYQKTIMSEQRTLSL